MDAKVTDEMLMAFVDGELDPSTAARVGKAVAGDPTLTRRVEEFRSSRRIAQEFFGRIWSEPVPTALIQKMRTAARPRGAPFRRRALMAAGMTAMAASLALAVGLGYLAGLGRPSAVAADSFIGSGLVADALGRTASGEAVSVGLGEGEARLTTLATFRVDGGFCRTFRVEGLREGAIGGVGCDRSGDWRIDLAVAQADGDGFAPASGAALGSIDAFLDSLEAEGPLGPEDESRL